jgi:mycofactocin glycosyltransferase
VILVADASTSSYDDGRLLLGGSPRRALRLTGRGAERARALLAGTAASDDVDAALARRLLDAGLAHPAVPPTPRTSGIDVVVPAYGDRHLDGCLAALAPLPVTVVDDGSPEKIDVATVRLPVNRGPSAARNAGLAATTAPIVAFVDSDVVVSAESVGRLASLLDDDPRIAAVAPRISPRGSRLDLGSRPGVVRPGARTSYVPSTVLVVRRAAVEAVGGFDEALRVGEDVDLVWRLVAAGWMVRYVPELSATHHEPSGRIARLDRSRRYGTAAGPLGRRHPAAPLSPPIGPVAAVVLALAGRPRMAAAVLAAAAIAPARRMHAAGVPAGAAAMTATTATSASTAYAGRWLVQLWSPVLLGLIGKRRRPIRVAVAVALAMQRVRVVDDLAYGAGVWTSCLRTKTWRPLVPRWFRS